MIAEYILNNIKDVCFMTCAQVAKNMDTSDTSVIRTCKALGYSGFNGLQQDLRKSIQEQDSNYILKRIKNDGESLERKSFITQSLENLNTIFIKNSSETLESVLNILEKSPNRYLAGYRGTEALALRFGFLLKLITSRVYVETKANAESLERLLDVKEGDCVFLLGYDRYSEIIYAHAEIAKKQGARLIIMSDRIDNRLKRQADEILLTDVEGMSFFNSNLAGEFLIEWLCTELSFRLENQMKERINFLEPFLSKHGIF